MNGNGASGMMGMEQRPRLQGYRLQLSRSLQVASALRYPQYRRFWTGNLASVSSNYIVWVAQGWLVYELTGSKLALGYVGLVTAIPAMTLNLVGGVLADKLEQRRLILAAEVTVAGLLATLATLTALHLVQLWHVLAIAFVTGAVRAFNQPARNAFFPLLIDRKELMNAVSLNSLIWEGTKPIVPALAGIIIAQADVATAYYIAAGGHLLMAFAVLGLNVPPVRRSRGRTVLHDMGEGLKFIVDNGIFAFLIGMSFFTSFFGMSYSQLMPVFARDILSVGPTGFGFLHSASGLGALLGTLIAASLGHFQRKGWLLVGGAAFYGGFLVLFALSRWYALSLAAVFLAGGFHSVYMITTQTTLQMLVPDELRGRVMGIYGMLWNVQPLGGMQAGAVASLISAPFAVALGGVAVAAYALGVASSNPRIRRLGVAVAAG